jgi:hypothetical protein
MKSLLLAGLAGALIVGAACGGNVVVDGAGGTGGVGPATNSSVSSSSSVSVSSSVSTSSGQVCSCEEFCGVLQGCNFAGVECASYCYDTDPQTMLCVCNSGPVGCDAVSQCFSGTSSSNVTVGVGGSGGGSGTPSPECWACLDSAQNCAMAFDICTNNPDCQAIIDCHGMFNWTYEATGNCDPFWPNGYGDFNTLMNCAVCQTCFEPCAKSSLVTYCFDG